MSDRIRGAACGLPQDVGRLLLLVSAVLLVSGCNLRQYAIETAVGDQADYIPDTEHYGGWDLKKVSEHVYTYRWTWDRGLVVLTDEGVVVVDPFNREAARILKGELDKLAPGKPVHTLFYSHYHLDHT